MSEQPRRARRQHGHRRHAHARDCASRPPLEISTCRFSMRLEAGARRQFFQWLEFERLLGAETAPSAACNRSARRLATRQRGPASVSTSRNTADRRLYMNRK